MAGQTQLVSQDRKLYIGMSITGICNDETTTEKEKVKLIELFNKANTNGNTVIDPEEIEAYDKNLAEENDRNKLLHWKNVITGIAGAVTLGITGFMAYKGIKSYKNISNELARTKDLLARTTAELDVTKAALNDAENVIAKVQELAETPSRLPFMEIFKNIMNKATQGLKTTNEFTAECGKLCKNVSEIKNTI